MSDLIDRKELLDFLYELEKGSKTDDAEMAVKELIGYVASMPSAEPECKTGRWIIHKDWSDEGFCGYECPECGRCYDYAMNFCGFCGEKMEVEHE